MQQPQEASVQILRDVVKENYSLPEQIDPFDLVLEIMPNLHSTDPDLRDRLTYNIITQVLVKKLLTDRQIVQLLSLCTSDQYLFHKIGEIETDSVFARSFGALIVAVILEVDAQRQALPKEQISRAIGKVVRYAFSEKDYRGFVDQKGWAHSVAHAADALDACAHHPYATHADLKQIMDAILKLATVPSPLNHLEDDRLAYAALRLILRDKDDTLGWVSWISKFDHRPGSNKDDDLRNANAGHFLRALYLMLLWEHPSRFPMKEILTQIRNIHAHYQFGILPIKQL